MRFYLGHIYPQLFIISASLLLIIVMVVNVQIRTG